jgi:hypothetical protein
VGNYIEFNPTTNEFENLGLTMDKQFLNPMIVLKGGRTQKIQIACIMTFIGTVQVFEWVDEEGSCQI